jgi:membrane protease YdiL (CAAX protease family)
MPAQPTPAQLALSLIVLGLLSAILVSWVWAISRLATGRGLLPPAPIREAPWRGTHVLGMILLYLGVQIVAPVALFRVAAIHPARLPDGMLDPQSQNLAMIAVNATFLLVGPLFLASWTKAGPSDFGLAGRDKFCRDVLRGIVAWPLLAPIVYGVMLGATAIWPSQEHPLQKMLKQDPSSVNWGLAALSAAILAPAVEEFLFRGVLLGWLGRWASGLNRVRSDGPFDPEFGPIPPTPSSGVAFEATESEIPPPPGDPFDRPDTGPGGDWTPGAPAPKPGPLTGRGWRFLAANVAVSALFAAMHGHVWPTPLPLFFLSMGLGVLYQRTGGLVAPIALHTVFNGLSTFLFYLTLQAGGPELLKPKGPVPPPPGAVRGAAMPRDADGQRRPQPVRIAT